MPKPIYTIISILFLLFISEVSFSESQTKIDSLRALTISEGNQENLVTHLNNLADIFSYTDVDSAIFYGNKALLLSNQIDFKPGKGEAHFLLGYYYDQAGRTIDAIEQLQKAIDIFIEIGDSSYLSKTYNNLGVMYSYGKDQTKSLEYFIKAKDIAETQMETFSLSEGYSNIGSFYELLKEYGSALKFYKKGLDIDIKIGDVGNIALSHLDIGNINIELRRFEEAFGHLTLAQQLMPDVKDKYRETELYLRFADYYLEMNTQDSVKTYLKKAKYLIRELDYPRLEADIFGLEADCLLKQQKYKESLQMYNKAIDIFNNMEVKDVLYELLISKAEALSGLGLHVEAYAALQRANILYESLKPNEIAKVLGEFERVEAGKEEKDRLNLERELQLQQNKNAIIKMRSNLQLAIFSIALLLILISISIYFYLSKRKHNGVLELNLETINQQKNLLEKDEKKLVELNATKDKFFSIIAHDLKSPFSALIGLSDIMLQDPEIRKTEDFDEIIGDMFQAATSGYNLLENLLEWARAQTGNIQYNPQSVLLKNTVQANTSFLKENAGSKGISFDINMEDDQLVFADQDMTNCIIRNLLSNAIKFSYPNSFIKISASQKNDFCIVEVQDKGVGMSKETLNKLFKIEYSVQSSGTANEIGTGLGLILCKEFIEKNKGEIWVESEKGEGSTFRFSLPLSKSIS